MLLELLPGSLAGAESEDGAVVVPPPEPRMVTPSTCSGSGVVLAAAGSFLWCLAAVALEVSGAVAAGSEAGSLTGWVSAGFAT